MMNIPVKRVLMVSMMLIVTEVLFSQSPPPIQKVVDFIDKLYRADSSYALMEMEIVTPEWRRTLKMRSWSEGTEKTFIRILEPQKERGMATLKIGTEMWNYLPKVRKEMRIPPSMMMSSWMGSDFTNDDLVKEYTFAEDYVFRYLPNADIGRLSVQCVPKEGRPIVWSRVELEVDAESLMPLKEECYDEKGTLVRVLNFKEVRVLGGRLIPTVMELVPQKKSGNMTVIRYLEAEFNVSIPADTFTKRNLADFRG